MLCAVLADVQTDIENATYVCETGDAHELIGSFPPGQLKVTVQNSFMMQWTSPNRTPLGPKKCSVEGVLHIHTYVPQEHGEQDM